MKALSDGVEVQRLGDRIVISSADEDLLNSAIKLFEQQGAQLAFVGNLRGSSRFTAILNMNGAAGFPDKRD